MQYQHWLLTTTQRPRGKPAGMNLKLSPFDLTLPFALQLIFFSFRLFRVYSFISDSVRCLLASKTLFFLPFSFRWIASFASCFSFVGWIAELYKLLRQIMLAQLCPLLHIYIGSWRGKAWLCYSVPAVYARDHGHQFNNSGVSTVNFVRFLKNVIPRVSMPTSLFCSEKNMFTSLFVSGPWPCTWLTWYFVLPHANWKSDHNLSVARESVKNKRPRLMNYSGTSGKMVPPKACFFWSLLWVWVPRLCQRHYKRQGLCLLLYLCLSSLPTKLLLKQ